MLRARVVNAKLAVRDQPTTFSHPHKLGRSSLTPYDSSQGRVLRLQHLKLFVGALVVAVAMAPSDAASLTTTYTTGMMLADNTAMASTEIVAMMTYGTVAMSPSNAAAVELARDLT
jgi:hypothetical protein